jgi:hypothetical protein
VLDKNIFSTVRTVRVRVLSSPCNIVLLRYRDTP